MLNTRIITWGVILTAATFTFFILIASDMLGPVVVRPEITQVPNNTPRTFSQQFEISQILEFAFLWTLRTIGALIAILAAMRLFLLVGQQNQVDQIVQGAIALLGGLLLVGNQPPLLAVMFGGLAIALLIQQIVLRRNP